MNVWRRVRPDMPPPVWADQPEDALAALYTQREALTALYRRLYRRGSGACRALAVAGARLGETQLPALRAELFLRGRDAVPAAPALPEWGVLSALREAQRRESAWAEDCRRAAALPGAREAWLQTLARAAEAMSERLRELLAQALR